MIEHIENVLYLLLLVLLVLSTHSVCSLAYMAWSAKGFPVGLRVGMTGIVLMMLTATIIMACAFISEVIV